MMGWCEIGGWECGGGDGGADGRVGGDIYLHHELRIVSSQAR